MQAIARTRHPAKQRNLCQTYIRANGGFPPTRVCVDEKTRVHGIVT